MDGAIDLGLAFLIGACVGLGELVGRYRDEPGRAVRSRPAMYYAAINGAASALALILVRTFNVTFGMDTGTVQARALQVLGAGFGAMAIFRSSIFIFRKDGEDIGIGPIAFLSSLLEATDRAVDRNRARGRAAWVEENMNDLEFDEVALSVPAYAAELMQNLSKQDQAKLADQVKALAAADLNPKMRVKHLGLQVMNAVGEEVTKVAVMAVRSVLGKGTMTKGGGGFFGRGRRESIESSVAGSASPSTSDPPASANEGAGSSEPINETGATSGNTAPAGSGQAGQPDGNDPGGRSSRSRPVP